MKKRNRFFVGLCIVILLIILPFVLATERPVRGWVNYTNSTPVVGMTVSVHAKLYAHLAAGFWCYCDCPNTTTSATGEYVENFQNLKYVSNCWAGPSAGDDCGDNWDDATTHVWMDGYGFSATPATVDTNITPDYIQNFPLIAGITYLTPANISVDTDPPNVTLVAPANNSEWNTSRNVTFTYNVTDLSTINNCVLIINGSVNATDNSIQKYVNQTFVYALGNANYSWSVNCTDAEGLIGESETWLLEVDVPNNPPDTPTVDVIPDSPSTNNDLLCTVTSSNDPDGDSLTYYYKWFNESVLFLTVGPIAPTSHTLGFANTTDNETWTCNVTAYDGEDNSSEGTDNVTIVPNALPTAPIVNVTPQNATTIDDLLCNITVNSTDADNDNISYYFRWYNGSTFVLIVLTNDTQHTLGSGNTTKHQEWNCSVVPYDGSANGSLGWDNVTILNTPPVSVTIPDQSWLKDTNNTNAFDLDDYFSDVDNDVLIYNYTSVENITVQIAPNNSVSFIPDFNFSGTRYIIFSANDSDNITYSNNVTLHIYYCGDGTCDANESCSICSADCGSCPNGGGGGGGGGGPPRVSCQDDWDCGDWSVCINGLETRTCRYTGNCAEQGGKPIEERLCGLKNIDVSVVDPPSSVSLADDEFIIPAKVTNIGSLLLEDVVLDITNHGGWSGDSIQIGDLAVGEERIVDVVVENDICSSSSFTLNSLLMLKLDAVEKEVQDSEDVAINFNVPKLSISTDRDAYSEGDIMRTCIFYNNAGESAKTQLEFEFNLLNGDYYTIDYLSPFSVDGDKLLIVTQDTVLRDIPLTQEYMLEVKLFGNGELFSDQYLIAEATTDIFLNGIVEDDIVQPEGSVYGFKYNQEDHSVTINDFDENFVEVTVASDPKEYRIEFLQTITSDLDGDGEEDISLTYLGVINDMADIRIRILPKEPKNLLSPSKSYEIDLEDEIPIELEEAEIEFRAPPYDLIKAFFVNGFLWVSTRIVVGFTFIIVSMLLYEIVPYKAKAKMKITYNKALRQVKGIQDRLKKKKR